MKGRREREKEGCWKKTKYLPRRRKEQRRLFWEVGGENRKGLGKHPEGRLGNRGRKKKCTWSGMAKVGEKQDRGEKAGKSNANEGKE